jgi:hypothetical protein
MDSDEPTRKLLEEIRDVGREHLAEYRRVTQESLELQRRAVGRQEQIGGVYRRVLIVGGGLFLILMVLLLYLLLRYADYLFR